MKVRLNKIAHARSGDKGDRADIGLFAYDAETFEVLRREVTSVRVAAHFKGFMTGQVERYELPNIWALKFVLNASLQGGGSRSLRLDNLGKTIGGALLRMEIDAPESLPRLAKQKGKP